jgi:uncharacterized protein (DUF885 family)
MNNRFRLKCWAAVVAASFTVLSAPGARGQQETPSKTESAAMRSLADEFFTWRAVTQPVTGDDVARVERPAGWAPDVSPGALAREAEKLAEFRKRFSGLKPEVWPTADRVDYLLLRSAIERVDWELSVLRLPRRDPRFYYDQTVGALFEQLTQPPPFTEARTRNILACVEAIPATLGHARVNLTEPVGPFADVALAGLGGIADRFARVSRSLAPLLPEAQRGRFEAAMHTAGAALAEYAAWLRTTRPAMNPRVAVGREAYEHFLKYIALIPYSSDDLLRMGQLEWNRAVAFEAYAAQRNRNVPPARLFANAAEQAAATASEEEKIRRFLVEKAILDVPPWMGHYRRPKIPEYLEALGYSGVPDDLTGPSRLGQDATSYNPEPSPNLGFFGLASAQDPRPIIVHEGVPGHFFQLALSWANPDPIRRHYFDSGSVEGIGFYAEEVMLQFGLFDDAPHTLEIIYRFMRLRALRVTADIKLARGDFSIDEAAKYLATTVPMDEATARQEAAFFAGNPGQAISYQIGKLQILKLIADARTRQGSKFDLKALHNSLWQNANVPIALQRWELLGEDDEIRRLW